MKRVSFKTVGCRLNQAETAEMAAQFETAGYQVVDFGSPCEICVVHSCAVTRKAEQTSLRLARVAKKRGNPHVVLTGCVAETADPELLQKSDADQIVPQSHKYNLPAMCAGIPNLPDESGQDIARKAKTLPLVPRFSTARAQVKIQDGCDFNCAYCIVPRARGFPASRPIRQIVELVEQLSEQGFREVVLTGANLGCYRDGRKGLADLIEAIESIPNLNRIRISSIELSTAEREIIEYMSTSRKLCRYLHIPLQSGDDGILSAMGRRYSAGEYRKLIEYAISKIPLLGIGTDIIVGFPGENEAAFENTFQLAQNLPFSNLHIFPYSKRPGTRAAIMPFQISVKIKQQRTIRLRDLEAAKRAEFAQQFIGHSVNVLVERVTSSGKAWGWTGEYLKAVVPAAGIHRKKMVTFIPRKLEGTVLY